MSASIDINADMGEYATVSERESETSLMAHISSCSIACGGHAGDEHTIAETAKSAAQHNIAIGAHPSYPDRENFGRVSVDIDLAILRRALMQQLKIINDILARLDTPLHHIKLHGALYNDAARRDDLAELAVDMAAKMPNGAALIGPPQSKLEARAKNRGIRFLREGFVDRLYQKNGALTPRTLPGAVITDIDKRIDQGVRLATGDIVNAADGSLTLCVQTLCIHSDSPGSVETAAGLADELRRRSITIGPPA